MLRVTTMITVRFLDFSNFIKEEESLIDEHVLLIYKIVVLFSVMNWFCDTSKNESFFDSAVYSDY